VYFVTRVMEKKRQRHRQSGQVDIDRADGATRFEASDMWGKTVIAVARDGVLVDQKSGVVFPFSGVKLGPWTHQGMSMGTTLHLLADPHLFVVGGVDHRNAATTPLEAPDVEYPDVTMRAPEFGELLTALAGRCGWDARRPTSAEPTWCVLIPNTSKAWTDSMMPGADFIARGRRKKLPHLAIAAGKDVIWVVDQNNAPVASAPVAQVTATPAFYNPESKAVHAVTSIMNSRSWQYAKTPVLVLSVPGLPPLTIGCPMSPLTSASRFEWRGDVHREKSPDYLVSGADWLTLVEAFGLAPRLLESVRTQDAPNSAPGLPRLKIRCPGAGFAPY
jgi:hypothetical protein